MSSSIPQSSAELTADWFNRTVAAAHERVPTALRLRIDDGVHQGMMSQVCRMVPEYANDSEPGPASLIVKLSAAEPAMRQREGSRRNAVKEVRFYQTLRAHIDVRTPACYLADVDVETGYHVLVLEDLGSATLPSRRVGCSRSQAERAVDALAGLHAQWWDNPELDGLDWLSDPEPLDPAVVAVRHRRWWQEFLKVAGDRLPDEMIGFGTLLAERFAGLMNRLVFESPRTLRHGDFGLSNLLFEAHGPPIVIDWQMMSRGKGPWDLAWFLGQSLTGAQRRSWERELLSRYHSALVRGGVRDYGVDACLADYRLAIAQRFGTLISSLVALPFTAEQKAEILEIQVPRNVAAVLDHGGVELLD